LFGGLCYPGAGDVGVTGVYLNANEAAATMNGCITRRAAAGKWVKDNPARWHYRLNKARHQVYWLFVGVT
jgi:hypothetical protein